MTRAQIKTLAQGLIRETLGSPTEGDIFTLDALLDVLADEWAQVAMLYYVTPVPVALVANQIRYPIPLPVVGLIPAIHHIQAIYAVSAAGARRLLTQITPGQMIGLFGAAWENLATSDPGDPTATPWAYAVMEGGSSIRVSPTSSVSRSPGLMLTGYGSPRGMWPNETDECPLMESAHEALAFGLAVARCDQYPEATAAQVAPLRERAEDLQAVVFQIAGTFVQAPGMNATARTRSLDGTRSINRARAQEPTAATQGGN